jgi:exopolysaccharide biosynthesis polyprenyl glycosylphosphotransferase
LDGHLRRSQTDACVIVGRIAPTEAPDRAGDGVPLIGRLGGLCGLVTEHDIDLLVMSAEVPTLTIFDEAVATCMHLPVRVCTVAYFYEAVFGHVRAAEINATWFQCIMHPRYRASSPSKRAMDVIGAILLGLAFLPLFVLLAAFIRRDGGPVFFKQARIGECGRRFLLYKLRTMRPDAGADAQWAAPDDPRVTRIGRVLRRTHVDELPQLLNVLRGEMSLVGPRPEQPEFVDRLEKTLPFYQRRHLIRPGITGWAQIRCGYADSDLSSAWKLCHDLYYMKYRSITLDLTIVLKTLCLVLLLRPEPQLQPTRTPLVSVPVASSVDDTGVSPYPVGAVPSPAHAAPPAFAAVNSTSHHMTSSS